MTAFRISTWNVNSLRVRLPQVLEWLQTQSANGGVDVLGLQETKLTDDKFPHAEFEAAGYHSAHNGQKTYNGVAQLPDLLNRLVCLLFMMVFILPS